MNASFFCLLRVFALGLLLSSCAHKSPKPLLTEDWLQHRTQVSSLGKWQATGKLAVKVPDDGGSMSLRWQQQPDEFTLEFTGPFGQNLLSITGQGKSVQLNEPGKPTISASTAEELIRRNTGWTIPVTQLAFWVRGLPDPHARIHRFTPNTQGLIGELEQLDWRINYSEYIGVDTGTGVVNMPKRIIADYKDMRLTLVIREWQLESTP